MIKPEMEALDKAIYPHDNFAKYDEVRVELAKKYAKKNEKGELETIPSEDNPGLKEYVLEDKESFDKEITKLQEEHKDAIEERKEQIEQYNQLLAEEIPMIFHKVKVDDVPADITTAQMSSIFAIIAE